MLNCNLLFKYCIFSPVLNHYTSRDIIKTCIQPKPMCVVTASFQNQTFLAATITKKLHEILEGLTQGHRHMVDMNKQEAYYYHFASAKNFPCSLKNNKLAMLTKHSCLLNKIHFHQNATSDCLSKSKLSSGCAKKKKNTKGILFFLFSNVQMISFIN